MSNLIHTSAGNVYAPGLKQRQQTQAGRIAAGVKSGQIDQTELAQLKDAKQAYRTDLAAAKANDGKVDKQERVDAHQDLRAVSASIYEFRHN